MQTTCGIEEYHVVTALLGILDAVLCDFDRIALAFLEHRNTQLLTDSFQLLDRCGTVNVTCDQYRILTLTLHVACQLCTVGGLTCTLQAHQHDNAGSLGRDIQFGSFGAHESDQFFINDLNDHLTGIQTFENVCTHRTLSDLLHKVLYDLEVYVSFQKSELDLTHGFLYIRFLQTAFAGELFKRG